VLGVSTCSSKTCGPLHGARPPETMIRAGGGQRCCNCSALSWKSSRQVVGVAALMGLAHRRAAQRRCGWWAATPLNHHLAGTGKAILGGADAAQQQQVFQFARGKVALGRIDRSGKQLHCCQPLGRGSVGRHDLGQIGQTDQRPGRPALCPQSQFDRPGTFPGVPDRQQQSHHPRRDDQPRARPIGTGECPAAARSVPCGTAAPTPPQTRLDLLPVHGFSTFSSW